MRGGWVASEADFNARRMGISEGSSAVTWPSVLLRPSTHQIGAFRWLGAEGPTRRPKRLLTSKAAPVIKLLKTSFRTEGVVLVLYRLGQLNAALPTIMASFDLHQCDPSKAILEMKRVSKSWRSLPRSTVRCRCCCQARRRTRSCRVQCDARRSRL